MEYVFSCEPLSASMLAKSFVGFDIVRDQIISFLTDIGYIADIKTITELGLKYGFQYKYGNDGARWPVYSSEIQQLILDNIDRIKAYEVTRRDIYAPKVYKDGTIIIPDATITNFADNNEFGSQTAYKALVELGCVTKDSETKNYTPTDLGADKGITVSKNKRGFRMVLYPANVQRDVLKHIGISDIKEIEKTEPAISAATIDFSDLNVQILSEYPLLGIDNFVVIDTETTGMAAHDEVIELAIVNMDGTVLYDSTFCPTAEVNPCASAVNHLTNEYLCNSPKFADEWNKIKRLIGNKKILAHNGNFDKRIIKQTLEKYNLVSKEADSLFENSYDSVNIARKHIDSQSYSLENLAHFLGIERAESHRAADDCIMTLEVLGKMERLLAGNKQ